MKDKFCYPMLIFGSDSFVEILHGRVGWEKFIRFIRYSFYLLKIGIVKIFAFFNIFGTVQVAEGIKFLEVGKILLDIVIPRGDFDLADHQ